MNVVFKIVGLFCLIIGTGALRGIIHIGWNGYVSPPLNFSELPTELYYLFFSFVPVILILFGLDKENWQKLIIGGTELIVIISAVYDFVDVFSHGR